MFERFRFLGGRPVVTGGAEKVKALLKPHEVEAWRRWHRDMTAGDVLLWKAEHGEFPVISSDKGAPQHGNAA